MFQGDGYIGGSKVVRGKRWFQGGSKVVGAPKVVILISPISSLFCRPSVLKCDPLVWVWSRLLTPWCGWFLDIAGLLVETRASQGAALPSQLINLRKTPSVS